MGIFEFFNEPKDTRNNKKLALSIIMVLISSYFMIMFNRKLFHVDNMRYGIAGMIYAIRYIPLMITAALGGAVPALISVLLVFAYNCVKFSSFSYLTFIYLVVACVTDFLARRKWFNKAVKIIPVTVIFQLIVGLFWGFILLLLSDYGFFTFSLKQAAMFFANALPGGLFPTVIIYLLLNKLPEDILVLFGNGKYYVNPALLTEDEKYDVSEASRIGLVIMNIIVSEALILGFTVLVASNTLIPTIQQRELLTAPVQRSIYGKVYSTDRVESLVSLMIQEESMEETSYFGMLFDGTENIIATAKFSVRLAMLISVIIIPFAVFINRYAQKRIARPIRTLSRAMSEIYNAQELSLDKAVANVHELDIDTRDEIEELYHSVDLTLYRLVEYIELVRTRQNIEDQLEIAKSANEAKSRFLSNISHEIRTPINAVLGFDEMIIRESDNPEILGYARDIQGAGKTLLALINDILDFSKIEAGKMEIIPVEYELGSVMNDIVNMAEVRAREKNLKLNISVNDNIPHILFGDEIRIKQCIVNIITNAVKYTEEGHVDVSVDYEVCDRDEMDDVDDRILLKISVADTGIGIREEDMDKLLSAFERIDVRRNRTIEGTGLGISIVTSLLGMMGSKLDVESEYGKGSTFSFAIEQRVVSWEPVGDFAGMVEEARKDAAGYRESFHAPEGRILVVDDTRTNLTVIQGLLKHTQIKVDTATSGMEAIEMCTKNRYHMIFLDHRMPEMDGIQTFHALQENPDNLNKDVPVISLTANAISGSREMYFREGFTNYMSKPVDPPKLEEMILTYLPKDIIFKPGDQGYVKDSDNKDQDDKAAMSELLKLSGIDVNAAIKNCGSALVARDVMRDFYMAIEERADLIEKYAMDLNIKDYTIYVHGLKSSARAIGALDLSERAEYLEQCGNGGDIEEIEMLTPKLLEQYRGYLKRLESLMAEQESDKPEIPVEDLEGAFASIKEFVSASYFDSADDIMKMLEDYSIPKEYRDKYRKVKKLMAAVDRDGLLNVL